MQKQLTKLILFLILTLQLGSCQTKKATVDSTKVEKKEAKKEVKYAEGKMANGIYFLINTGENLALEPYQRQYGSLNDLNLVKLDNSAVQKWVIKENLDLKTKKPNGTFSIYLFVDETNSIANKYNNPRLGKSKEYQKDNFSIQYIETEKAYIIKSITAKGDCLGKKDGRFAKYLPNDGSKALLWKFLKTE